ncbi:hypothetical protein [Candidatus Palauibacter sp.]|uniref:hypothetical protein n=1 Tax=Candidatus Palauibacter sp. TaxID=3101350 RepID=UPI003B5CE0A3
MRTRTRNRVWGGVVLTALLAPSGSVAQEQERPQETLIGPGLVLDEDGERRLPTPADALRAFWQTEILPHPSGELPYGARTYPAIAVLRQEFERHPAVELDAVANALADSILAYEVAEDMTEEYYLQGDIFSTLTSAARAGRDGDGTPHAGSFDALVRIYETVVARELADGGTDPVEALRRRGRPGGHWLQLKNALRSIFQADMEGRGADYVLAVVAASEPPNIEDVWPMRPGSLWCEAADIVRFGDGPTEENPRRGELPPLALDDERFYQLCGYH